jgi:diguanylate cyclase (GGDEF)-like protein
LSEDNKAEHHEVFAVLSELSSDFSVSMSAYRKESYGEKEIGNTKYAKGVETVLAADVATAGKRIARDLQRLSKQLKDTGNTEPEVIKILNEIDEASVGEVKFYESVDLLSKVTWILYRLNDKSVNREKEYLVNMSSQFSEISKSCIESMKISNQSEEELKSFDDAFLKEIEAIFKSSKSAESLSELKVALAIHIEKMQDKLSRHMLNQSTMIKKQKTVINSQVDHIDKLSDKIDDQQNTIHEISIESGLDQLTRLPNRRSYDEHINKSRVEFISKDTSLSLMLLDIDHFKKVNDTYGHASGDVVLKDFSKILTHVVGKVDGLFASRYGGEEFAIIGNGIPRKKFINIGKKIKEFVSGKNFNIGNGKSSKVTVSIGVSFFNGKDDLVDSVFRSADKALYQAKESGRNQLWISNKTLVVKSEENDMND